MVFEQNMLNLLLEQETPAATLHSIPRRMRSFGQLQKSETHKKQTASKTRRNRERQNDRCWHVSERTTIKSTMFSISQKHRSNKENCKLGKTS